MVDGFTPAAKRVSMIGMFENIGRPSTMRLSKFCPEETDDVSSSGVSAVTFTVSATWPISIWSGRLNCCPTARTRPVWVTVLKPVIATVTWYVPGCSSGASK